MKHKKKEACDLYIVARV